jgi:hypothetical protein
VAIGALAGTIWLLAGTGFALEPPAQLLAPARAQHDPTASPALEAGGDWWSAAKHDIAAGEYRVTWQRLPGESDESAWHAPNRAQGLRSYFTKAGISVVPRTEEQPSWQWGLELVGYGWHGAAHPVAPAEPRANENRVEYARDGLVEWYVNKPRGLEQGFTLERPKSGTQEDDTSEVVLELTLRGDLAAYPSEDGQSIEFAHRGVRVLRYSELEAADERGRPLRAHMEVGSAAGRGAVLRIVVETDEAVWPITVDPLATSPCWTGEGDQGTAYFGMSVASAGDVNGDGYADIIVGAVYYDNGQTDEGRAYVYHGSASGVSTSASWTAESDRVYTHFGQSVASAGDVNGDGYSDVIIGADFYSNGEFYEGRAYAYHGSASGLSASASWTVESNQADARLGWSVASAGDVNGDGYGDVIVGAYLYDNGQDDEGRAYVYHGAAAGLSTSAAWSAEGNQASANFGRSVATAGDVNGDGYADVVIGAHMYDNAQADEGRAFVYHGAAGGLATTASWTAESNQVAAYFGESVASAGDVNGDGYADVVVGARQHDNVENGEGRAYVYHGSGTGLAPSASWTAEINQSLASFGYSVATAGDVNGDGYADLIIGAPMYNEGGTAYGAAFVYLGAASGLASSAHWMVEGEQASAYYGASVATAGDVNGDGYADVIVGAYWYSNGQTNEGRAYVYLGGAAGISTSASWSAESGVVGANFGDAVASAGDVDGDGFADVIVGASYFDNGQESEGRAFVYHGSATGLSTSAAWSAEGGQDYAFFGVSVASAGDVNGDGFADVIAGARYYSNGQTGEGAAFVYHGSASGLQTSASWTAEGGQAEGYFGRSVASAGDINGDGYADVIVGAHAHDNGHSNEGRAYVFHGSAAGLSASASWTAEGTQTGASFGFSVASAGDVNGDGYADVIVGAYGYDNGETDEGRAFVFLGSAAGLETYASWTADGGQAGAELGRAVAAAGDVDGDGFGDVIIGACEYENGQTEEGRVVVHRGTASGLTTNPVWTAEGDLDYASLGAAVASAGDVNGDGYADIIVGADLYNNGEIFEGRALVWLGSASGLGATGTPANAAWMVEGGQASAYLGTSVASAGDVNGDGYADIIVGAPSYDNGQINEGRAYVFYGNGGTGRRVAAQQLRGGGSLTTVQPWGRAVDADDFQVGAWHSSPFGRERVKIEIQGCPNGVPFGHASCLSTSSSSWTDTTVAAAGVQLRRTLGGLTPGTLYRWRERTLRAPFRVSTYGITPPPNPAHSPWRRLLGQAFEADIRTGNTYSLTVARAGTGSGSVTSTPAGIDCGATCVADFVYNTEVTLSAHPAAGSTFTGWSGWCAGAGDCSLTMAGPRSAVATFAASTFTLTVSRTGAGSGTVTSSPAGISCGAVCAYAYAPDTVVTLTAAADPTASFAGWTGEGCSGLGTCQVTMSATRAVQAMFIIKVATGFYPVTPCRMLDTRVDSGPTAAAPVLAASSVRSFSLLGKCGLASGAKAISVNLTVVGGAVEGDLQVLGGHLTSSTTSSIWIPISRARANNALVQLSTDSLQTISVINTSTGSVHFILDINGYFL